MGIVDGVLHPLQQPVLFPHQLVSLLVSFLGIAFQRLALGVRRQ